MEIPTYGKKQEGVTYQIRVGAYIVISRQEGREIVLVQAPNGAFFLPGGEIEAGESKEEAIDREMLEELGYQVAIGAYLGQADEYFHSNHRQTDYHNPGYFFSADSWEQVCQPLEDMNQIKWFPVAEAKERLKRGSHKWAVETWEKQSL